MTPLLLTLGIYCNFMLPILMRLNSADAQRRNFIDNAFFLHLAGLIYFWVKVSDLWFGWSA